MRGIMLIAIKGEKTFSSVQVIGFTHWEHFEGDLGDLATQHERGTSWGRRCLLFINFPLRHQGCESEKTTEEYRWMASHCGSL